ncbi:uncharacterized protein LOC125863657 [Solanum stenotomum]|uniref:uncharacterized protein LOC125863657 n=1 Tax=Solanum stenotomum TaxID=172797 RepID=UPI0020D113B0|nr:uncharacterized protein LOC125863657 [Solanum stenotomum]
MEQQIQSVERFRHQEGARLARDHLWANRYAMWEEMNEETNKWPYDFPASIDYLHANQRGSVSGQLMVHDWYINVDALPALYAFIGLAEPGLVGSWQSETKEIGFPDRTANEFFIPDPLPGLQNYLYTNTTIHKFRQYGLWDRYTDLYPNGDLVYKIGVSDFRKDWFFAHVNRRNNDRSVSATTWQIVFDVKLVDSSGTYHLHIALASASYAHLLVWINTPSKPRPWFDSSPIGMSNAIARHGIHGLYMAFDIEFSGTQLYIGENIIYLKQASVYGPFTGLMYDYIRLEGPSTN